MNVDKAIKLGAKIQKARRNSGKELVAISGEICVSKSYLTAIEAGDFEALPAMPFSMGFIRSFANEVGLSAEGTAKEFKAIVQPVELETETVNQVSDDVMTVASSPAQNKSVRRGPIYGGLAVVLSAMSAVWMIFVGGGHQAAFVKATPPSNVHLTENTSLQVKQDSNTPLLDVEYTSEMKRNDVDIENDFAPASNQLLGVANASEVVNDIDIEVTEVMFEAKQDSWVRISSKDTVLFEGILRAGDHYVPPMGPSLNLTTSNAGGLALYIGEHNLGVLGGKGDIIKNVNIDPDSLILRLVETL